MKSNDLEQAIEALKSREEPMPDLWQGIEAKLAVSPDSQKPSVMRWGWRAVAVVSLVAMLSLLTRLDKEVATGPVEIAAAPSTYVLTTRQLQSDIQRIQQEIEMTQPSVLGNFSIQSAQFEQATQSLQQALVKDPGNETLVSLLIYTYQQQLAWTQAYLMTQVSYT